MVAHLLPGLGCLGGLYVDNPIVYPLENEEEKPTQKVEKGLYVPPFYLKKALCLLEPQGKEAFKENSPLFVWRSFGLLGMAIEMDVFVRM